MRNAGDHIPLLRKTEQVPQCRQFSIRTPGRSGRHTSLLIREPVRAHESGHTKTVNQGIKIAPHVSGKVLAGEGASMSAIALTLDEWQIRFYEAMAAVLRAKEAVKQQFGFAGLLNGLWRASRNLKSVNESLKALSEAPDGLLPENFAPTQIPQIRKLLRSIEDLLDTAKAKGLFNRSLTGSALEAIRKAGDAVADHLDTLEMSIDPEVLSAMEHGQDEIESGNFCVLESLS